MKNKKGFTLIELMVAVLIFSFMLMSMVAIYVTSEKHFMQSFRTDKLRTSLTTSIKFIRNTLSTATRIDNPTLNNDSNILAFASNVDNLSGCYPLRTGVPVETHYFCVTNCPNGYPAGVNCLYYHNIIIGGGAGCPGSGWNSWANYPNICGRATRANETVVLLMSYINQPTTIPNTFFSRRTGAPLYLENDAVRVALRLVWNPPVNLQSTARPIDTTLETNLISIQSGQ